ncbi:MAG: 2-hydroxyacid dehydrogenase [Robiginitalea sp.]|nr:2-hydroxyacid dehydrogenase [Robiginitalea sp.]
MKKILHVDENHPLLIDEFEKLGFQNELDYTSSREEILDKIAGYQGLILRSRLPVDRELLDRATSLEFIGRLGAGLENIDVEYARNRGVFLAAAPEGNRNAVGEHALGMLLSLFNKLNSADAEVRRGLWRREENRGLEVEGKTIGIIGYGNTGKAFAKKLRGFEAEVICYDIVGGVGNEDARQVGILEFRKKVDVVSLHVPQTPDTIGMVDERFIGEIHNPFWLLNTARGKCVKTGDLVKGLQSGKVLGAGLDVLEYEKASFESLFQENQMPAAFKYLIEAQNVLLTPHVAGWTVESKEKLARTIVEKVKAHFNYD